MGTAGSVSPAKQHAAGFQQKNCMPVCPQKLSLNQWMALTPPALW
jgi:hypothetical protein